MSWLNLSAREKSIQWWRGCYTWIFPRWRYEFLSIMIVRLNSATADYAPACDAKFTSHDRWYMGKSMSYYNAEPVSRQEIQNLSHSKENFGCIHEPLLNIPLTHVIDPWWTTFIAKSNRQTTAKCDWWTVQQRDAIEDFNKPRGVNQRKDISQGLLKKLINWELSPYGTKRMQMALRNSPAFWASRKKKFLSG